MTSSKTPSPPATLDDIHDTLGEIAASADRIADAMETISASLEDVTGRRDIGRAEHGFIRVVNLGE